MLSDREILPDPPPQSRGSAYASVGIEYRESEMSRPAEDAPMPWLVMTPEREAALLAHDFTRNKYTFALRGKPSCGPGEGWVKRCPKKGVRLFNDTMALSELHRLEMIEQAKSAG